jgi:hypothetical protein
VKVPVYRIHAEAADELAVNLEVVKGEILEVIRRTRDRRSAERILEKSSHSPPDYALPPAS